MRDELHQSERLANTKAKELKTIQQRSYVLLKILNSGKCFVYLNNLLAKSIGE